MPGQTVGGTSGGLPGFGTQLGAGSYASTAFEMLLPASRPPTTKNLPLSVSPETKSRGTFMFASVVHVVVDGSYDWVEPVLTNVALGFVVPPATYRMVPRMPAAPFWRGRPVAVRVFQVTLGTLLTVNASTTVERPSPGDAPDVFGGVDVSVIFAETLTACGVIVSVLPLIAAVKFPALLLTTLSAGAPGALTGIALPCASAIETLKFVAFVPVMVAAHVAEMSLAPVIVEPVQFAPLAKVTPAGAVTVNVPAFASSVNSSVLTKPCCTDATARCWEMTLPVALPPLNPSYVAIVSVSFPSGRSIVSVHLMLPALAGSGPHCPGVLGFCEVEVTWNVVVCGRPPAGVIGAFVLGLATAVSVTLMAAVAAVMYLGCRAPDCAARAFALGPFGMMKVSVTGAVPGGAVWPVEPTGGVACEVPPPPPQPARRTAAVKKAAAGRKTVNTGTSNAGRRRNASRPRVLRGRSTARFLVT